MGKKSSNRIVRAWRALWGKKSSNRIVRAWRVYDGATSGGRAASWVGDRYDANSELAVGLDELRQRSRDLIRNNAYARKAIDALTNSVVSTGIRPTVDTGDKVVKHPTTGVEVRLDDLLYELWEKWGQHPVSGSQMDIYGLEQLACRAMFADGETVLRIRPRSMSDMPGVPPVKLQPLEADHLPSDLTKPVGGGSLNRIISAVEVDALGEPVAFHVYREHPGLAGPFGTSFLTGTVRIPASSIIHGYRATRPGQLRGEPILSPVILSLWDLAGYTEAIRVATRAAATLVATVEGGDESDPPDGVANDEDDSGNPLTDADGNPIEFLQPGGVIYAAPGKKVTIHSPQPPSGVAEFINAMLHEIAAGVGLSYHTLSGDMSDSSFAQAKLGLIDQARQVEVIREQVFIPLVLNPIWKAFIDAGIAAGLIPNDPDVYAVSWSAPLQQQADRLDEVKAAILEMQAGLRDREGLIEAGGRDPDKVNEAIARDKAKRLELGIVSLGDLGQVTTSGQAQVLAAVLGTPPDKETDAS